MQRGPRTRSRNALDPIYPQRLSRLAGGAEAAPAPWLVFATCSWLSRSPLPPPACCAAAAGGGAGATVVAAAAAAAAAALIFASAAIAFSFAIICAAVAGLRALAVLCTSPPAPLRPNRSLPAPPPPPPLAATIPVSPCPHVPVAPPSLQAGGLSLILRSWNEAELLINRRISRGVDERRR